MLRFRLKERLADKEFREARVITMVEVSEATGIHRMTLSRLSNHRGYNPTADVLDRLCSYFGCSIDQLVEHIPDVAHNDNVLRAKQQGKRGNGKRSIPRETAANKDRE